MADTVLGARWIIFYEAENRNKRIIRDTSVSSTTIDTVNQLYSALQNQFDEIPQMDDGTPMSAQTPTEYTIGIIDAGDKDPWFIDRTSMEYLKGGAIKTASWTRTPLVGDGTGTIGIIQIKYTATTNFDATDIGRDIVMTTDNDKGTILDFNDTGAAKVMWIRPKTNTLADSFDNAPTNGGAFTLPDDSLGQVWQVLASGPTYVDFTTAANNATANDWTFFPAGTTADYAAIGYRQKFKNLRVNVGTAGTGAYTVAWQYWNGASWTALTVTDGTNGFQTSGLNNVVLTTVPTDWAATSLNGSATLYYVRALKNTGSVTVAPLGTQGFIGSTGATLAQVNIAGGGSAATGESLWANIYSLGTIEKFTHLYVYQNGVYLTKYKSTTIDWWGNTLSAGVWADGHIDILVSVKELGVQTDAGFVTVFARQYGKTYDNFIVDLHSGGRNPIPMATGGDLNNTTGFRQFVGSSGVGTFTAGNFIYSPAAGTWTAATKRAVMTAVSGSPGTTPTLTYYLIGDLTDFVNTDTIQDYTGTANGTATCTAAAPTAVGPSTVAYDTGITMTYGANTTFDINENGTNENYSIVIDLTSTYTVLQGYERTKYLTRYGGTTTSFTNTIKGERYIGSDYRLAITGAISGTVNETDTVSQATTLAAGTIIARNATASPKLVILRNSRGTFDTTDLVTSSPGGGTFTPDSAATALAPIKAAPFGTFAGGTWFCAPGVVLKNVLTSEANKYQLTDDNGNSIKAPTKVTITVGNTRALDRIGVFRLTAAGGTINKAVYNATVQSIGVGTAVMGSAIATDEPGKTAGGVLRLVDTSASLEYRMRFSSWTASTFTLQNYTFGNLSASTTSTSLVFTVNTELANNAKVGDLVFNSTRTATAYIITIAADNLSATISPAITSQVNTDTIKLNVLPVATTTTPQDTYYVPFIDVHETTGTPASPGSQSASVTFSANIAVRVRARQSSVAATAILPYEADATVTSNGLTNNIIRTADTIFT